MILNDEYLSYLLAGILHMRVVNTPRSISGSLSQSTRVLDCMNPDLGTAGMKSMLSQISLDTLALLISRSWHRVNAVLSVFFSESGAFSCQKRSPPRRRLNCSAMIH